MAGGSLAQSAFAAADHDAGALGGKAAAAGVSVAGSAVVFRVAGAVSGSTVCVSVFGRNRPSGPRVGLASVGVTSGRDSGETLSSSVGAGGASTGGSCGTG